MDKPVELEQLLRIGTQLTVDAIVEHVHLATIACVLNVQILLHRQILQPSDGDQAVFLTLSVTAMRHYTERFERQEAFAKDVPGDDRR